MSREWPCSKCRFASVLLIISASANSAPVICSKCRSKESTSKAAVDPSPNQLLPSDNIGTKIASPIDRNSSVLDQISPSRPPIMDHQNVGFAATKFGMVFGNLPLDPTPSVAEAIPVVVQSHQLQGYSNLTANAVGFQSHLCNSLKASTTSVLEDGIIQIKQELIVGECEKALTETARNQCIWDSKRVQRKRRSKLPQYALLPVARFINQLQHASCSSTADACNDAEEQQPKYNNVLIYEKCKFVGENEIGLGAMLLAAPAPAPTSSSIKGPTLALMEEINAESCSTDESDACNSNCLVDVPITGITLFDRSVMLV